MNILCEKYIIVFEFMVTEALFVSLGPWAPQGSAASGDMMICTMPLKWIIDDSYHGRRDDVACGRSLRTQFLTLALTLASMDRRIQRQHRRLLRVGVKHEFPETIKRPKTYQPSMSSHSHTSLAATRIVNFWRLMLYGTNRLPAAACHFSHRSLSASRVAYLSRMSTNCRLALQDSFRSAATKPWAAPGFLR